MLIVFGKIRYDVDKNGYIDQAEFLALAEDTIAGRGDMEVGFLIRQLSKRGDALHFVNRSFSMKWMRMETGK